MDCRSINHSVHAVNISEFQRLSSSFFHSLVAGGRKEFLKRCLTFSEDVFSVLRIE